MKLAPIVKLQKKSKLRGIFVQKLVVYSVHVFNI